MSQRKQRSVIESIEGVRGIQQIPTDAESWHRNLEAFLAAQTGVGGPVECGDVQRPRTGAGGGNILFSATADFGGGRETRRFVLRYRHPMGILGPYLCDIPAQFCAQRAVSAAGIPVPEPLWLDPSGTFLDYPGYVMEFVRGHVPPQNYFHKGVIAEAPPEQRREMILNIVRTLAKVHAVDWQAAGLGFLKHRGEGKTWLERDLGWYMSAAAWMRPDIMDPFRKVFEWIVVHQPETRSCVLNHGDSNPGNYMFEESGAEIVAVLDWEMVSLNPREVDLAYLCVLNEGIAQGAPIEGVPEDDELLQEYASVTGYRPENFDYYRIFVLARVAIILRVAERFMTPEQREAARAGWGLFEDRLFERLRGEI
jgi:aminoglycoside phosphotransferase (APT) family kinase protein